MTGDELKPFAVRWEARGRLGFNEGQRRVCATDEKDAAARAPRLIARDNAWPEADVQVLEVTPIEAAAP